jgi:hypothetical protein
MYSGWLMRRYLRIQPGRRADPYVGSARGLTGSSDPPAGVAREHEHDQAQVVREQAGASLRAAVKRAASARRTRPRREPGSVRGIRAHVGSTPGSHDSGTDPHGQTSAR